MNAPPLSPQTVVQATAIKRAYCVLSLHPQSIRVTGRTWPKHVEHDFLRIEFLVFITLLRQPHTFMPDLYSKGSHKRPFWKHEVNLEPAETQ